MTETHLTQDQGRALLQKLAHDDSFRELFETAPARALHVLGLDAETIIHLPPACLCGKELAPKNHYADLLGSHTNAAISSAMRMIIPLIGFNER